MMNLKSLKVDTTAWEEALKIVTWRLPTMNYLAQVQIMFSTLLVSFSIQVLHYFFIDWNIRRLPPDNFTHQKHHHRLMGLDLEIEFYVWFAVIILQQLCTVVDLISHSGFATSKRLLFFFHFNIYTQHGWITPCCCLQGQWKVYKMYQYHRRAELFFIFEVSYHRRRMNEWM